MRLEIPPEAQLLNPAHPDYRSITLVLEHHPFEFDPRLFD